MMDRLRARSAAALVLAAILASCSEPGAAGSSSGPTEPPASAAPSVGVLVIEDAGLETEMVPGVYESRLFEPKLRIELGEGWFRRDAGRERTLNLRRLPEGAEDVTFVSGLDFLQCGATPVVDQPDVTTVLEGLAASPTLAVSDPIEVPVGARTGTMVRLRGGGEPVSEEDFGRSNEFGCIVSLGEAPFPADSAWMMFMPDTVEQLVFVDVDGRTVVIRSRPDADPEGFFDFVLEVLETTTLG